LQKAEIEKWWPIIKAANIKGNNPVAAMTFAILLGDPAGSDFGFGVNRVKSTACIRGACLRCGDSANEFSNWGTTANPGLFLFPFRSPTGL